MIATILLVRHAATDATGRLLAGRAPGHSLNAEGQGQVRELALRLAPITLGAVYSSPVERARATAEAIAAVHGLDVQDDEAIQEIDFGEWTGRTFEELDDDSAWRCFNVFRSGARIPGGELMVEAQTRALLAIERLRRRHPGETIALVSHGDIVKAVVAHFVGTSLDQMHRLEISPASVSVVQVGDDWARVLAVNHAGELRLL